MSCACHCCTGRSKDFCVVGFELVGSGAGVVVPPAVAVPKAAVPAVPAFFGASREES